MKKRILLRADANAQIATGHVFRLLAFAEMLNPKFDVWFVTQTTDQQLLDTISKQVDQHRLINLPSQFEYCLPSEKELNAEMPFDLGNIIRKNDIVVTDGYWFREKYQQSVKNSGAKLIMIDDFANQYFYSDAVINHAPGLSKNDYEGELYTEYYLGLSYALIRKVFFDQTHENSVRNENAYFISFGGTDPYGLSIKFTQYLLTNTSSQIHLITSKLFPTNVQDSINQLYYAHANRISIYNNLNAIELRNLLDTCTYAIVPSSTILYECLARGLKCITGYLTQNQIFIYNGFINENYCVGIGDFRTFDTNLLNESIAKLGNLIANKKLLTSEYAILNIVEKLC